MDTKLKKFNDHLSVRVIAFIACIALILISGTTVFIGIMKIESAQNSAFGINLNDFAKNDNYYESDSFARWTASEIDNMSTLLKYGSRENIENGKFLESSTDGSEESNYEAQLEVEYNRMFLEQTPTTKTSIYYNTYGEDPDNWDYMTDMKPFSEMKNQFVKDYPEAAKSAKDSVISYQLGIFDEAKSHLDGTKGVGYSVTEGKTTIAGPLDPADTGLSITYSDGNVTATPDDIKINDRVIQNNFDYGGSRVDNADAVYTISLSNELVDEINSDFTAAKQVYNQYSIIAVTTFIVGLALLIYLMIITGRRDEEGKVKLYRLDKLFTELQFAFLLGLCGLTIFPIMMDVNVLGDLNVANWTSDTYNIAFLMLGIALEAIILSGILWFTLSIIRMLKAHIFLSRSLIVIAVKAIYKWIKATFSKANPMGKCIIIIVAACLISMIPFMAPVVIILLIGFGYNWIRKYTAVKKGVEEVTSGNLDYKIPVDEKSNAEFDQLARQINTISQASNIAIQNELKNQRLKTDLISNVSHDLKTPLTSIITYTDLLKKEGLTGPNAENYLHVIDEKGQRLKTLTEDLFEAAKASSGSIPVRMEKVDVLALIRQGLVEKGEGLDSKGLEVIVSAENENYYVNADGQLLWRVVENLLNNVEKYALENSRVYIDLSEKKVSGQTGSKVLFEMKNMSRAPLNIPEDELMERFKRGDTARATEGSGLGLAIAKDLIWLQGGWFELKIDGDLFKSTVMLDAFDEKIIREATAAAEKEAEIEEKMMSAEKSGMPKINNR